MVAVPSDWHSSYTLNNNNNNNNNNTIRIAPIKSEDTDTEALGGAGLIDSYIHCVPKSGHI